MSTHEMALLLEEDAMNVDGSIQGMQGLQGMQGMQGMDAMGGMAGMDAMGGLDAMGAMDGMDAGMALDEVDLFGDPVMDNALAALPARPPPSKPLLQRLDDLRTRGCCQAIAWSRQGTIAAISKDGMSIDLRFIRCRPEDGDWELSEPSSWSAVTQSTSPSASNPQSIPLSLASAGAPFVHLAWGPQSFPELVAIDALGRISILSFSITINRAYPIVRRWDADPTDDLHAIVGCYWLPTVLQPTKQVNVVHGPATRNATDDYKYEHHLVPASGPWHPNPSKSSLLCVTTNGALKLFFLQSNGRLEETAIELESVTSSDDIITHASLCSDKNTILLALATSSKQLKVVRVNLQWGLPQVDKQVPPGSVPLRPSLREGHVAVTSWVQHGSGESTLDASMAELSHIEVLPSALETPTQAQSVASPVILTVRSYVPQDTSPYHQETHSIIDRWEVLSDQPQSLHPAFEQLGIRDGAGSAPPTMTRLRKLEPIVIPKIIVSVHTLHVGRVLCFAFSDGTVQYRDRFTMSEMYTEQNIDSITSPLQVGFHFANETPCLQVAFSPTNCSFVQLCEDWTVKWNKLHYAMEEPNSALQSAQLKPILASLSIVASAAGTYQFAVDDVLAVARPLAAHTPNFPYAWMREMINALRIVVDYSEEVHHDQLVRNSHLQTSLSMLSHLGFQGDFKPRPFSARFAALALNVRNMVVLVTIASNTPVNIKEKLNPLDDPEVVDALAGCAKWGVELLAWLTDCLFGLLDDPEVAAMLADPKRFTELARYLQAKKDVSLHLLLCSSTRGFLAAACRRLTHLETISARAAHFYESNPQLQHQQQSQQQPPQDGSIPTNPPGSTTTNNNNNNNNRPHPALYQAYLKVRRVVASALVKPADFERLLASLSKDIQSTYQRTFTGIKAAAVLPPHQQGQQQLSEQQQQQLHEHFAKRAQALCELDMLLGGSPPPTFREVLGRFFREQMGEFRRGGGAPDPGRLYFAKYEALLEVEEDERSLAGRRAEGRYVDVFRRVAMVVGSGAGGGKKKGGDAEGEAGAGVNSGGGGGSGGGGDGSLPALWRRCVRCASVMEDVWSNRPGFHFVLAQQRKCACGGNWGIVPRGG